MPLKPDTFANLYKPDVISCLADLSNDEVFTPPDVANKMLDMLPQELFRDPNTKFLDPACKSGVFLREIAKRLIAGLADKIPNLQERCDWIFQNQLYGIAITELTSLLSRRSVYCSKYPNSPFSITKFEDIQGKILYHKIKHRWQDGKCIYCGISENSELNDASRAEMESHAYEFIHTLKPEEIFKMKFDVVISNPPYQINVGVEKDNYAIPIYNKFVEQAEKLNPRYMTMIIPARWYAGGRGLDDFRSEMLKDSHIRQIVDYPNPYDCFQGVDVAGGICYFLWDRDHSGNCQFTSVVGDNETTVERKLDEYPIFVRDVKGLNIVKKILDAQSDHRNLSDLVSPQTPFGIHTSYKPTESGIPCWFTNRIGKKYANPKDINDNYGLLNKWKLLIPKAPIAGQTDFTKPVGLYYQGNTVVAKPGECCTQTWLVVGPFNTEEETLHFRSYLLTKTIRFLILQAVVSQDVGRNKFIFAPNIAPYTKEYNDEILRDKWNITDEEWNYINSRIHNYGQD